jgi:hypothetical protein
MAPTSGRGHTGGIRILQAPDLDSLLSLARKLSMATSLPIEVRPFMDPDAVQTGAWMAAPGGQTLAAGVRPFS